MPQRHGRPHAAFLQFIAAAPVDSSPWRSAVGGLIAMRLVDVWAQGNQLPQAGINALERAIKLLDFDAPERAALTALSRAMAAEGLRTDQSSVLALLRNYVEVLWNAAESALAIDVCHTILRHRKTPAEHSIVPSTFDRLGHCLRARGQMEEAAEAFEAGRSHAFTAGDSASELQLRISKATLERQRGNIDAARRTLDEVRVDAMLASQPILWARATHDLGVMASATDDHLSAVTLYLDAFERYNQVGKDRVLADIALVLLEQGLRDIARYNLQNLAARSVEQSQRWTAQINLMRIAALDQDEPLFNSYVDQLSMARLPARHVAHFHLLTGEGWLRFEQPLRARRALARAKRAIDRYQIGELEDDLAKWQRELEAISGARRSGADTVSNECDVDQPGVTEGPTELHQLVLRVSAATMRWERSSQASG